MVAKKKFTDVLKLLHRAWFFFATNPKMVLVNDDQCIIADIVLALRVKLKNLNHPSVERTYSDLRENSIKETYLYNFLKSKFGCTDHKTDFS